MSLKAILHGLRARGLKLRTHLPRTTHRRGAIVVMAAVMMVFLLAMVAFAVDSGYMLSVRTELQRSADAGAIAGASGLAQGAAAARSEALRFVRMNNAGARTISASDVTVELGQWNKTTKTFTIDNDDAAAVRVSINQPNNSVFFGRVLGRQNFSSRAEAIAVYKPRDIVMTLDYSGSMCFDSQLMSINALGRATVENNLRQIYQELGSPTLGLMQFTPVYIGSGSSSRTIKRTLGLSSLAYPYPGGSWDDYIDYVQNDYYVNQAGYRNRYGYLTWVNYLQARQNSYADTPDLWQTSEQPVTAVKDAVDLFAAYIGDKSPDDRLGLSIYTSANNTAILEHGLTHDYSQISTTVRHRQAGHYVGGTNIYDGMRTARLELENNARVGAMKLIVLMTDGVANMPGNAASARNAVLQEARTCADANIKVIAIALGVLADTALMQEVGSITGGAHFIIPGGRPASEYEEDLKDVFREVAADRPLELVK